MVRIKPEDIRKKGKVPKNASLFFTIFQTFMSGPPEVGGGLALPISNGGDFRKRQSNLHGGEGKPSPYFGNIRRTSSILSSSMSAIAAAPTTKATGTTSLNTLSPPCSSA